jgi:hypothetical protein
MRKGDIKQHIRRLATAGSLLGLMGLAGAPQAWGEEAWDGGARAPVYYYAQDPSPSDVPDPAAAPSVPAPANGASCDTCNNGCDTCADEEEAPWSLLDLFACGCTEGWILGGHTQIGYMSDPDGAFTGNGPFVNQKEYDRLVLNQQYFQFGKVADGSQGLGLGGRADLMYGVDGNEGQSFGNVDPGHYDYLNGWDHGIYEWALPQLYGEVAVGDLAVKIGHFYTIIGYEVVPSSGQFFYSRQLTFWNSEPFTHTGALASYSAGENLTINGGWTFGMDSGFYQFGSANAFLGGFTYALSDSTSFVYAMTGGNLGWRGNGAINSMIISQQWTDRLSSVHQFDILSTDLRQANGLPADFADPASLTARDSTGLINYLFYDINDVFKAGLRYEWYRADSVSYHTVTYGLNILTGANLRFRPEIRHMFSSNNNIYNGPDYSDELFNQTVFGIDGIFTF